MTLIKPMPVMASKNSIIAVECSKLVIGGTLTGFFGRGMVGKLGGDIAEFSAKRIDKARGNFPEYNPANILESAVYLTKKLFSITSAELK